MLATMALFHELSPQAAGHAGPAPGRRPVWATSTLDGAADASASELSTLGAHVDRCNGLRGRLFPLHCAADALAGFLAPRIVTTLVVLGIVIGVGSLIV
jgi:hypothetical protein